MIIINDSTFISIKIIIIINKKLSLNVLIAGA